MKVAVNTLVVIILGLSMFSAGTYFLTTIVSESDDIRRDFSQDRRQRILQQMPANQEVYLPEETVKADGTTAVLPIGVYNRYDSSLTVKTSISCVSCTASLEGGTMETTLESGDRKILQGLVTNETWSGGQHVLKVVVENASGSPTLGTKTFYVEG